MASTVSRPPRVLLVGPFPPTTGGVTTFMLNLMGSFLRERFEYVPFSTSRPRKKNTMDNWGYSAMFRGGIMRILTGTAITAFNVMRFPFVVIFQRVDIVQIQASDFQAFWESALYALMARWLGRPVIFRIGGAYDLFWNASMPAIKRLIKAALHLPHTVIAQSEMSREVIVRSGREGPIFVLPNWPSSEQVRDPIRPDGPNPRMLFIVGTDAKRKGIEEVVEAARILAERGSSARFHLLAVSDTLTSSIANLRLSNIAAVLGFLPHQRVLETMRTADVFLLPSHGEGFPNSLIEAMACGLPSIVTPVGSVPEIARGGGAIVVPVGDARKLADAIDDLARDRDARIALGNAALKNLQERYTAERNLPGLEAVYTSALGRGNFNNVAVATATYLSKVLRPVRRLYHTIGRRTWLPSRLEQIGSPKPRERKALAAKRVILIGPIAQPGLAAKGGYESSNLRLLSLLRSIVVNVSALPYPETKGSQVSKTAQYVTRFVVILAEVLAKSGHGHAIHFTPLFRRFVAAEVLIALAARARGYSLTIDIRAGSQAIDYRKAGPVYRWLFRVLISLASAVTFEGEAYRAFLEEVGPGRQAYLLPNYVNETKLRLRDTAIPPHGPRLIYVGAVSEAKGVTAALNVLRAVRRRLPGASMTLVGSAANGYQKRLLEEQLDSAVTWVGAVALDEVEQQLDGCHFFLLLSHWFGEGQSNALTEAMARGCVPIVTDHGFSAVTVAVPDLVVIERDDSEAIASLIERIWVSGEWIQRSQQMVARVASHYTDRQVLGLLRKLYS